MIVGQDHKRTTVELVDMYDNSTSSTATEALYLFGFGGPPGLRILGGSTLIVHNINVYARIEGEWVRINALFPPGAGVIEFDEGYIARTDLADVGDCDFDADVDWVDLEGLQFCMSGPGRVPGLPACTCQDIDGDRDVDLKDFSILQRSFTGE